MNIRFPLLLLTPVLLCQCAVLDKPIPERTAVIVGGKNPVMVDISGLTWRDALIKAGAEAARIGANYAVAYADRKLKAGSGK